MEFTVNELWINSFVSLVSTYNDLLNLVFSIQMWERGDMKLLYELFTLTQKRTTANQRHFLFRCVSSTWKGTQAYEMTTATSRTTPTEIGNLYFFRKISTLFGRNKCFFYRCQNYLQLTAKRQCSVPKRNMKNRPSLSTFSKGRRIWSFNFFFVEGSKVIYQNLYEHAQPLFCSLNLLFDVLVAVDVLVFVKAQIFSIECCHSIRI